MNKEAAISTGARSGSEGGERKKQDGKFYAARLSVWSLPLLVGLMILIRVVFLTSDAFPHLSWSSALLTDEGFYIHDARDVVLFDQTAADGRDNFHNALIMPLLHGLQVGVFRIWGVGVVQARAISVGCSLLVLWLFWAALRRAFGAQTAWIATLLLGFNHAFALYNRLALMDTPALLPVAAAFYVLMRPNPPAPFPSTHRFARREGGARAQAQSVDSKSDSASTSTVLEEAVSTGSRAGLSGSGSISSLAPPSRRSEASELGKGAGGLGRFLLCGLLVVAAYAMRGLCGLFLPLPVFVLLWTQGRKALTAATLWYYAVGVVIGAILYVGWWYAPHGSELARVNHYYLHHQLKPDSLNHLRQNVMHALLGDDRGLAPYLMRHTPVEFVLTLLWLTAHAVTWWRGRAQKSEIAVAPASLAVAFLTGWLLVFWLFLAVVNYAPDRYYVLFYPAMAGLAALALRDLPKLMETMRRSPFARALLSAFVAYHVLEAFLHHRSPLTDGLLYGLTLLVGWRALLNPPAPFPGSHRFARREGGGETANRTVDSTSKLAQNGVDLALAPPSRRSEASEFGKGAGGLGRILTLYAVVHLAWYGRWLMGLTYTQIEADRWLATHLPANTVLIGDVAPGLCLNNRFRAVNVIPGLCNDQQPVEKWAGQPRYIVILDGKFKEPYWTKNYPELVHPDSRTVLFPRLIRLPVGVYAVDKPNKVNNPPASLTP